MLERREVGLLPTSNMEVFVTIVNSCKLLSIVSRSPILDVVGFLNNAPLIIRYMQALFSRNFTRE